MKLGSFLSGVFGTVGFGLSLLAGVSAGNTVESVLTHGLVSGAICYMVGYGVGLVAQQVALEHAGHISKAVAAQDAAEENKRVEEEAAREAEAAESAETAAAKAAPAVGGGH